jgi:hypothetical protein
MINLPISLQGETDSPAKRLKFFNFLLGFAFYVLLGVLYVRDIAPIWGYEGYVYNEPSLPKEIGGFVLLLLMLGLILFMRLSGFMYAVVSVFVFLCFIPNVVLFVNMDDSPKVLLSYITFILILIFLGRVNLGLKVKVIDRKWQIGILLGLIGVLFIPFFIVYRFNFNYSVFLLGEEVYDVRFAAREKGNILTDYTYSWLTNILLPIVLVLSIHYKKRMIFSLCILGLIYLFLCNAMKSVFLSIPFLILFYNWTYEKKILILNSIFVGYCAVSFFAQNLLISVFVNRTFFITGLMNRFYFEFFENKPIYLSSSIFRKFIDYPYQETPARLIGGIYVGNYEANANNGIPGDGYMNFGYLGVVIFAIVIAGIFAYLNSLKISNKFFGVIFVTISTLLSTELFTSLMTHGILVLLFVATFFLKNSSQKFDFNHVK